MLKDGESDAPQGLKDGLKAANRLQDLTMQFAKVGRTGNQALKDVRTQAIAEGIEPSIYCHPVGYHGHAAGPPIGMTDYQDGVPVRGDDVLRPNTWHSIELNAQVPVKEWGGQKVRFALEEDAAILADGRWDWILRRQDALYLIRSWGDTRTGPGYGLGCGLQACRAPVERPGVYAIGGLRLVRRTRGETAPARVAP